MAEVSDFQQLRAKPRLKLFQPTTLRIGGETVRAHLLDLSVSGAQVHAATAPPPGSRVRIGCGASERYAQVVWTRGRRFGVAFLSALSETQLAELVAARAADVAIASARIGRLGG